MNDHTQTTIPVQLAVRGAVCHGTTSRHLDSILRTGIKPRGRSVGQWADCPSAEGHVYLTNAYALYFARGAVDTGEDALLIEVDPAKLKTAKLYPDEDAVAQVIKGDRRDTRFREQTLTEATLHIRDHLQEFRRDGYAASWSMVAMGTCSHRGFIPVNAIRRIVRMTNPSRLDVTAVSDPSITVVNYRWVGDYYRAFQEWLMRAGEGDMPVHGNALQEGTHEFADAIARVAQGLRDSLSVVYERGAA